MPYVSGYDFQNQRSMLKIEINTGTTQAPVWKELCGLTEISFSGTPKLDTFSTLCDGAYESNAMTGIEFVVSGTAKFATENQELIDLFNIVFVSGVNPEKEMKITNYALKKIFTGKFVFVGSEMSFSKDEVISAGFEIRPASAPVVTSTP